MAVGDVYSVESDRVRDCWYLDTGMYDVEQYGAAYLLGGERPALVETGIGTNYERLFDLLDAGGVAVDDLAYICPTHVHLDHAGGAGLLAQACPNATVPVHERGAPHLEDPTRLVAGTKAAVGEQWRYYVEPEPVPAERIEPLSDGDVIDLGDRSLEVHAVPGHAHHQLAFFLPDDGALFTADAAGIVSQTTGRLYPTTPPPEFDLEQCLADVDRLEDLEPETLLYTHFGPIDDVRYLARYRDVLTTWVDAVVRARAQAKTDEEAIATLVEDRAPVDEWGVDKAPAETAMNAKGVLRYLDS